MADEITRPRPVGEEEVQDIQITLKSDANPISVRDIKVCIYFDRIIYHECKILSHHKVVIYRIKHLTGMAMLPETDHIKFAERSLLLTVHKMNKDGKELN